jgi:hypothetical protein
MRRKHILNTENGVSNERLKMRNPTILTSFSKTYELRFSGVYSKRSTTRRHKIINFNCSNNVTTNETTRGSVVG